MEQRRHTISVLVENEFGVLARVAGLFSSKGYNIDSLSVSETIDPTLSRMTIVTRGNDQIIVQILKQLNKLINAIKVEDMTREKHITREMCLVKVQKKSKVLAFAKKIKAKVLESSAHSVVLEISGDEEELRQALEALKPHGVMEVVRTGMTAIQRGEHVLVKSS